MPGRRPFPVPRIVEAPPDALLGSLELSPVVDEVGAVVDRVVTASTGTGVTLLFGEVSTARWRRIGGLDAARAAVMADLLGRVGDGGAATLELVLGERRILLHVAQDDDLVVRITFARVDRPTPLDVHDTDDRVARLRMMMSCLNDGAALYEPVRDETGVILDFVCLEMSDADPLLPAEEQIGQRLLQLFPETALNGTFDGYVRAIETGERWAPEPFLYQREGQTYRYRVVADPIDDRLVVSWHDTLVHPGLVDPVPTGDPLTARQVEVLEAIAAGRSTADIAADLHLSTFTVRNEVRRILAKLGVRTRAEAVGVAMQRHVISHERVEILVGS